MKDSEEYLNELKALVRKETKIIKEMTYLYADLGIEEDDKNLVNSQLTALKRALRKTVEEISNSLEDMTIIKTLPRVSNKISEESKKVPITKASTRKPSIPEYVEMAKKVKKTRHSIVDVDISDMERKTIKRLKKTRTETLQKKIKKPSKYVAFANKIFWKQSLKLSKKPLFINLKRDLVRANMDFVPTSYISVMFLSTLIAAIIGFFVFMFLVFFNIGIDFPIITMAKEAFFSRFLKIFWIVIVAPLLTFLSIYVYPSAEKSYIENKINQEIPFATIHMSAISQSMLEPSKIFSIIISTREYPFLQREFTKIINQVNVYGYDLVTALRNVAFYSPSQKLSELLNGLATTINSGGILPEFFDKRAQSLLFEYRVDREKSTKSAETFMDIYISLVIAAPMILMLLLIMMRISGLGVPISTSMITLIMILGVSTINALFLIFLQLKQSPT
ncbi:MAG: type II secretion system F family protein [Nanoarchaeota archaeon]